MHADILTSMGAPEAYQILQCFAARFANIGGTRTSDDAEPIHSCQRLFSSADCIDAGASYGNQSMRLTQRIGILASSCKKDFDVMRDAGKLHLLMPRQRPRQWHFPLSRLSKLQRASV